jgi:hypothetical protein
MTIPQYLRDEGLVIDEPYQQANLRELKRLLEKPSSVLLSNKYVVREENIFCHICGGRRHHKGITGLLPDGSRLLFGSHCAKEFFGPQIWNQSVSEYRQRQEAAFKRYKLKRIRQSLNGVRGWISRYEHGLKEAEQAWRHISIAHSEAVSEIVAHIYRNNGRIIEEVEETVSHETRSSGHNQRYFTTKIITAVRSPEAVLWIMNLSQNIIIVKHFASAVSGESEYEFSAATEQAVDMFNSKVLPAAKEIDAAAEFLTDFFSDAKLKVICEWSDRQRIRRLSDRPAITPRDLYASVRRKCGFGFERPHTSLVNQFPSLTAFRDSLSISKQA